MRWALRSLLLPFCLLLAGSGWAATNTYTISGIDPGGVIITYISKYESLLKSGVDIKVDGICISACTILLGIYPEDKVCMTARASFGFHEASSDSGPEPEATKAWARYLYPRWVLQWIAKTGGLGEDPRYMFAEDAKDHIKLCLGEVYTEVDPKQVVPDQQSGPKVIFQPAQPKGSSEHQKDR